MKTKDAAKDSIIVFRDRVEHILMDAGVNDWTERFDAKNKIVDAAIKYGGEFARECLSSRCLVNKDDAC